MSERHRVATILSQGLQAHMAVLTRNALPINDRLQDLLECLPASEQP